MPIPSSRLFRNVAIALLMAGLAVLTLRITIANVAEDSHAPVALLWNGSDARAQARVANDLLQPDATSAELKRARTIALAAIERDPTMVPAIRALGLIADLRGDTDRARALFYHADALTKRDLPTQLWMIEDAVGRDDVRGALRQFDAALRTSRHSAPILFPVLMGALEDPGLVEPIATLLAREPDWRPPFLRLLAETGEAKTGIARLLESLARRGSPADPYFIGQFVTRIVQDGDHETAWRLYSTVRPAARRGSIGDGGFDAPAANANLPFDWFLSAEPDLSALPARPGADASPTALWFQADRNTRGVVAQQMLLLEPGDYVLSGTAIDLEGVASDRPFWTIECVGSGSSSRVDLPEAGADGIRFRGSFRVPGAGCGAQWLRLNIRAREGGEVAGAVDSLTVVAAGA